MKRFCAIRILLTALCVMALILAGCGGSGSSSSSSGTGLYQINLTGGDSSTGTGGLGGNMFLDKLAGQGNVQVLSRGLADPSFVPQALDPTLAITDWIAPVGPTTIKVAGGSYTPTLIDPPYLIASDTNLYLPNSTARLDDDPIVTGVYIPAGATVILETNGLLLGEPAAEIVLVNDFYLAGTLRTDVVSAAQKAHLNLSCYNFFSTGTINTAGVTPGQNGGKVEIVADFNTFNHGPIVTSGADNGLGGGGHAGYISLETQTFTTSGSVENTGLLTAVGGGSAPGAGVGGNGGDIYFWPYLDARNSADIIANGGAGVYGGLGGWLEVITLSGGFASGGNLNLSGGRALTPGGLGGDGGNMAVNVDGGSITIAGSIDMSGADGLVSLADSGNGGLLNLFSYPSGVIPAGSITVSGNIDLSGGNTTSGSLGGGFAGVLTAKTSVALDNSTATVSFLGYKKIDLSGGDGVDGGDGGNVFFTHAISLGVPSSGKLINEAGLFTVGGNGDDFGGNGGNVDFDSMTSASNSANIIADGGNTDPLVAGTAGGNGGDVTVTAPDGFDNTGFITSFGGTGEAASLDGTITVPL